MDGRTEAEVSDAFAANQVERGVREIVMLFERRRDDAAESAWDTGHLRLARLFMTRTQAGPGRDTFSFFVLTHFLSENRARGPGYLGNPTSYLI